MAVLQKIVHTTHTLPFCPDASFAHGCRPIGIAKDATVRPLHVIWYESAREAPRSDLCIR